MSDARAKTDAGPPPGAGWFDDPKNPGRDRWWNGYRWTEYTAKTPRPSLFGPGYARSMRTRTNTPARIGSWAGTIAAVLMLAMVALVFAVVLPALESSAVAPATTVVLTVLTGLPVLVMFFGFTAIVFGAIGLARSPRSGALGASIHALVQGVVFAVIPAIVLAALTSQA